MFQLPKEWFLFKVTICDYNFSSRQSEKQFVQPLGLWLRDFLLQVNEIPTHQGDLQDPGGSAYCLPLQLHLLLSPFTNHTAASLDLCSDPQKPFPATSSPWNILPSVLYKLLGSLCSSSLKVNFPDSTMWPITISRYCTALMTIGISNKCYKDNLLPFAPFWLSLSPFPRMWAPQGPEHFSVLFNIILPVPKIIACTE